MIARGRGPAVFAAGGGSAATASGILCALALLAAARLMPVVVPEEGEAAGPVNWDETASPPE